MEPTTAISQLDKAYVAGLVDGEGHVTLGTNPSGTYIRVEIANNHLGVLQWAQARIGGAIQTKKVYSVKHAQAYTLRVVGVGAVATLRAILPYAIIKEPIIRAVLAYHERHGTHTIPTEVKSIKLLHKRGPKPLAEAS